MIERLVGIFAAALFVALSFSPLAARACAVCGCGDPTLTTMGTEQPYRNRLRASVEVSSRTDSIGQRGIDRLELLEQRLDMRLAWAPHERAFLLLNLPLITRTADYVNLARKTTSGIGDLELYGRYFLYRDSAYAPNHLVSITGGARLPTTPLARSEGATLPLELQTGAGIITPSAGLAYAHFAFPWSLYVSAIASLPASELDGYRESRTLGLTLAGQYQLLAALGLRLGLDSRLESKALQDGEPIRDSGGLITFAAAELLWSPWMDWMLFASSRLPVWNALEGHHVEGPIWGAGLAYDFN